MRGADPAALSFQNSQPGVACLDRQHLLEVVENTARHKHRTQPVGTKPTDLIMTHREDDGFEEPFRNCLNRLDAIFLANFRRIGERIVNDDFAGERA